MNMPIIFYNNMKSVLIFFVFFKITTAQGYENFRSHLCNHKVVHISPFIIHGLFNYRTLFEQTSDIQQSSDCAKGLREFAESASNFTLCAILNARPIHMCEHCITNYTIFIEKYNAALNLVINSTGTTTTTCKSILISNDKLEVVLSFHNNILGLWNNANCNACYDWSNNVPTPSNSTLTFYGLFNATRDCINDNILPNLNNSEQVCELCMKDYIQLDTYYESLSRNGDDLNNICMDIIDSMNTTRSTWSGLLNCCRLRKHKELIFLCTTGLLCALPLLFYFMVRYCGTMRDLPTVLKQSRFKQTFLTALQPRRRSS